MAVKISIIKLNENTLCDDNVGVSVNVPEIPEMKNHITTIRFKNYEDKNYEGDILDSNSLKAIIDKSNTPNILGQQMLVSMLGFIFKQLVKEQEQDTWNVYKLLVGDIRKV